MLNVKATLIRGSMEGAGAGVGIVGGSVDPNRGRRVRNTPSPNGRDTAGDAFDLDGDGLADIMTTDSSCGTAGDPDRHCMSTWVRAGTSMHVAQHLDLASCM
jgi:hypothetical protein